jgi:hypothetical protein
MPSSVTLEVDRAEDADVASVPLGVFLVGLSVLGLLLSVRVLRVMSLMLPILYPTT